MLGEKILNRTEQLMKDDTLSICFEMALSIDTGAALGLVDAIQTVLTNPSAPKIRLVNIKVKENELSGPPAR